MGILCRTIIIIYYITWMASQIPPQMWWWHLAQGLSLFQTATPRSSTGCGYTIQQALFVPLSFKDDTFTDDYFGAVVRELLKHWFTSLLVHIFGTRTEESLNCESNYELSL